MLLIFLKHIMEFFPFKYKLDFVSKISFISSFVLSRVYKRFSFFHNLYTFKTCHHLIMIPVKSVIISKKEIKRSLKSMF